MKSLKNRELLFSITIKDCEVDTFCSGGPGGQHQNKTESGVRITHRASGAVGEARDSKSQHTNKKSAWVRMCESKEFKKWVHLEVARRAGQPSIDAQVRAELKPENIKAESLNERNKWIPLTPFTQIELDNFLEAQD